MLQFLFKSLLLINFAISIGFATEVPDVIKVNKVKKISYLLASTRGLGQSSFGHAYLRFSYDDKLSQNDPVIEFVADTPAYELSYLRGLGVGENYPIKIAKSKYSYIKTYHNHREDRDLTSYVLNLSPEQIKKVVSRLNELLKNGVEEDYSFFTKNCAAMVSKELTNTIGLKMTGIKSVIPIAIPSILNKHSLIKDTYTDYRITVQREHVIAKHLKGSENEIQAHPHLRNIKELLASKKQSDRISGFTKPQLYKDQLSKDLNRRLRMLSLQLLQYEGYVLKKYFTSAYLYNKSDFDIVKTPIHPISRKADSIIRSSFTTNGENVSLNVTALSRKVGPKGTKNKRVKYSIPLPQLRYRDHKIIHTDGRVISYEFNKDIHPERFHSPFLYKRVEIATTANGNKYLLPILATEKKASLKKKVYGKKDTLAYRNGHNKGSGACYAHSEFVQLLQSSVIFDPSSPALTSEQNLSLVDKLHQGNIVVIPGFSDARSFTASMDGNLLAEKLRARHKEKYNFLKRSIEYFSETDITSDNMYIIRNLLSIGITPTVFFEVKISKYASGHSIVITKMTEDDDYYYFEAIDSNWGYLRDKNHFRLNKKTSSFETSFYGNTELKIPAPNLEYLQSLNVITKHPKLRDLAVKSSRAMTKYNFYLADFFR